MNDVVSEQIHAVGRSDDKRVKTLCGIVWKRDSALPRPEATGQPNVVTCQKCIDRQTDLGIPRE